MKLKSLTLRNVRSYIEQTIEFPDGTILFEGDMGSGKSTILMAIEFALFGLGSQRGASLLRLGENEGSVSLTFSLNGTDYEITRNLVRKGTRVNQEEGYIKTPQGVMHLSPAELKERVLEILNFKEPPNPNAQSIIYRYAVFTPQEEMKFILLQRPTDRVQTLRKAFGIEDYKTASENAGILARQINDSVIKLGERISDLEDKRGKLKESEDEQDEVEKKQKKMVKDRKALERLQNQDDRKLQKLRKKEKRYNDANSKMPLLNEQIREKKKLIDDFKQRQSELQMEIDNEVKPEIERLSKIQKPTAKTKQALKSTVAALRKLEKKKDVLSGKKSGLLKSIRNLEKKLGGYKRKSPAQIKQEIIKVNKRKNDIGKRLRKIGKELKVTGSQKAKLELQEQEIEERLDQLKGAKGVCPVCERELTAEHKEHLKEEREEKLQELREELPKIEKKEKSLESDKEELEKEQETLRKKVEDLTRLKELASDLESDAKRLSSMDKELRQVEDKLKISEEEGFPGLSNYENPSDYVQAVLDALNEYLTAQNRIGSLQNIIATNTEQIEKTGKRIAKTAASIESTSKTLGALKKTVEALKKVPEEVKQLEDRMAKRQQAITSLEQQIGQMDGRLQEIRVKIDGLKDEIEKKEKAKGLLEKFRDYHIWITDFLIPTFQTIEKQVMMSIKQEFESVFQKWYSMLIDEPDKEARIDEDFTPIVEQDGYEQDIDFLSGGERTSLALAYRLALNTIVQKVSTGLNSNVLILDEPTDGFSKSQLFKVREILRELNCPQVIMVSHETELESFADRIFQVQKSNGISNIISR